MRHKTQKSIMIQNIKTRRYETHRTDSV